MYMYTAIAPIPLSSFAGEPSKALARVFSKATRQCVWRRDHRARLYHLLGVCVKSTRG
jgi:hypothetical protein